MKIFLTNVWNSLKNLNETLIKIARSCKNCLKFQKLGEILLKNYYLKIFSDFV